jgi:ABC-type lipoprotein export system ATPase subunit
MNDLFNQYNKKDHVTMIIVEHKDAARDLYTRKIKMELGKI